MLETSVPSVMDLVKSKSKDLKWYAFEIVTRHGKK